MKSSLATLPTIILSLASFAQGEGEKLLILQPEFKTDIVNYDARGPRKVVRVAVYSVSSNTADTHPEKLIKSVTTEFDEQGNITYEKVVDMDDGKATQTSVKKYKKRYAETVLFDADSSYYMKETWRRKNRRYSYRQTTYSAADADTGDVEDEKYITKRRGRLIVMKQIINHCEEREMTISRYNRAHRKLWQDNYTHGKKWLNMTWEYDNRQKLIEHKINYIDQGKITLQTIYRHDTNGNILERLNNNMKYNSTRQTYKYDSGGREIAWFQYAADDSLEMKGTYTYGNRGNRIRKVFEHKPWKDSFETTFRYNKYDLKTEEEGGSSDVVYHYQRTNSWGKMDKYDNWLKVTEYYNGVCKQITVREIEYY